MNVFISYAQADEQTAKKIADGLKRQGLHVWDDRQILPGTLWAEEIFRALRANGGREVLSLEVFIRKYWQQDALDVARSGLEQM